MKNVKKIWTGIALFNLAIVASLGVLLRSKILFPLKWINFKYMLHAHSHFAFGGWITLALLSMMVYEILPAAKYNKPVYKWLLVGILVNALGMLFSFPFQGYAFFSILFSTLFIFVTYIFSWVFIRDLLTTNRNKSIRILCILALLSLTFSSAGPFSLAYLLASHSSNNLLYRDSIYTYLHLQYNGFFSLAVFALLFNYIEWRGIVADAKKMQAFATLISVTIIPTLFLSYLWHYPNVVIRIMAILGCILLLALIIPFIRLFATFKHVFASHPFIKITGVLSMIAFALKSLLQCGLVIPAMGNMVFGSRPIIIGYLHLVMLGFVSLYLLTHFMLTHILNVKARLTVWSITIFLTGIVLNEVVLMAQGLSGMLMIGGSSYPLLLWIASLVLLAGAILIFAAWRYGRYRVSIISSQPDIKRFIYSNLKKNNNYESSDVC